MITIYQVSPLLYRVAQEKRQIWMLAVAQQLIKNKSHSVKLTRKEVELYLSLGIMRHQRRQFNRRLMEGEVHKLCRWIRQLLSKLTIFVTVDNT